MKTSSISRTMLGTMQVLLSSKVCCGHHHCKFCTASESSSVTQLTFKNLLSDENKLRTQKRLTKEVPVRSTKDYKLKSDYTYAAVLVPLCTVSGEPSLLFTLRSSKLKKHRGQVSFPGGNVDQADKNMIQTALRETEEELGLDPSCFDVWGQMHPLPGSDGYKFIYPVLARTGELDVANLKINTAEVDEAFCVPIQHLCDTRNVGSTRFQQGPGFTLPVYLGAPHRIWGLTAVIVHQVLNLIAPGLYTFKVRHK